MTKKSTREEIHRLSFEREVDGKTEKFLAIYNEKFDGILFDGILKFFLEIDELIKFLNQIKEERQEKAHAQGICECGSKNMRLIGKGIRFWSKLTGDEFNILQCESCGRQFKKFTAYY